MAYSIDENRHSKAGRKTYPSNALFPLKGTIEYLRDKKRREGNHTDLEVLGEPEGDWEGAGAGARTSWVVLVGEALKTRLGVGEGVAGGSSSDETTSIAGGAGTGFFTTFFFGVDKTELLGFLAGVEGGVIGVFFKADGRREEALTKPPAKSLSECWTELPKN